MASICFHGFLSFLPNSFFFLSINWAGRFAGNTSKLTHPSSDVLYLHLFHCQHLSFSQARRIFLCFWFLSTSPCGICDRFYEEAFFKRAIYHWKTSCGNSLRCLRKISLQLINLSESQWRCSEAGWCLQAFYGQLN